MRVQWVIYWPWDPQAKRLAGQTFYSARYL